MLTELSPADLGLPQTAALRAAMPRLRWEMCPQPGTALALRVQQIRRANPELAAAIRAELSQARSAPPVPHLAG